MADGELVVRTGEWGPGTGSLSDDELDVVLNLQEHVPDFYVDLPEDIVGRMWDVIRAVADGHGDSGMLQAECIHLRADIDKLLAGGVQSEETA